MWRKKVNRHKDLKYRLCENSEPSRASTQAQTSSQFKSNTLKDFLCYKLFISQAKKILSFNVRNAKKLTVGAA